MRDDREEDAADQAEVENEHSAEDDGESNLGSIMHLDQTWWSRGTKNDEETMQSRRLQPQAPALLDAANWLGFDCRITADLVRRIARSASVASLADTI